MIFLSESKFSELLSSQVLWDLKDLFDNHRREFKFGSCKWNGSKIVCNGIKVHVECLLTFNAHILRIY